MQSAYSLYSRPELSQVLKKLKLGYEIVSGSEAYIMIKTQNGEEKKVLDLISGYGAALLGHNPPELVNDLIYALKKKTVAHAQLSIREKAGELSRELVNKAKKETGKSFIVTFSNTGAEAVETAMKHALMNYDIKIKNFIAASEKIFNMNGNSGESVRLKKEWQKEVDALFGKNPGLFLSLEGAFHGKTLGALSLTYNNHYRSPFETALTRCKFVDPSEINPESIKNEFSFKIPYPEIAGNGDVRFKDRLWTPFVALFAEPIQGEAGVFMLSALQAQNMRNFCDTFQIPLIWDEIQSGSYRTGSLFASSKFGVSGDYYLLGKSLGGGLTKISALMVDEKAYLNQFGLLHTSTFAEDELSCIVSASFLKAAERLSESIRIDGMNWGKMLSEVKTNFPKAVKDVRGEGLIWGIEFNDFYSSACYGLQSLSRGGYFNYFLAAWLLYYHQIRLSAPLSNDHTLRLHPSVKCTQADMSKLRQGLEELCILLECEDLYALTHFLLPEAWQAVRPYPQKFSHGSIHFEEAGEAIPKVGFITHYIDQHTLFETDPSLSGLPVHIIENLLEDFQEMLSPVITGARNIKTITGQQVHLTMSGAPFTAVMAKKAIEERNTGLLRRTVAKSVALLDTFAGPAIIGLGQYTSIISNNGLSISSSNAILTTGNGYTAYLTVQEMLAQCEARQVDPIHEKLAVFGAGGNIGSLISHLLLPFVKELLLLGNPSTKKNNNLKNLKEELLKLYPEKKIAIANDLGEAKQCRLVVVVTNQAKPFLNHDNLNTKAIVCDISVPLNICPELLANPEERVIIEGGLATVPDGKAVPTKGFPLPEGKTFACLAETLILGLENNAELASLGLLSPEKAKKIGELGRKHGFHSEMLKEKMMHDSNRGN